MCSGAEPLIVEGLTAADAMAGIGALEFGTPAMAAGMGAEAFGLAATDSMAGIGASEFAQFGPEYIGSASAMSETPIPWEGAGKVPAGYEGFGMTPEGSVAAMDTLGSTNWFSSAANTVAGGGLDMGSLKDAWSLVSPAMSIGSGLYGMNKADEMRKLALKAGTRSDPWGASGGRTLADTQLQELMRDPGQVAARDPSYALRMQGAQRATAGMGQDSGAMSVAGANASTDWFNARLAQLGGLAGAGQNPATGESISMQGQIGANDLASKSLASIGYGATRAGGDLQNMPAAVRDWFRQQGVGA